MSDILKPCVKHIVNRYLVQLHWDIFYRYGSTKHRVMATSPARKPHYLEAPQHFVVAVDGSDMSKGAFEMVYALARKGDRVTVVHLFDPTKEIPAHEMRPTGIYDFYSTRCVARFPSGCWKVDVREKPAGETTRQALLSYINQVR
jgi:hypothetical protein